MSRKNNNLQKIDIFLPTSLHLTIHFLLLSPFLPERDIHLHFAFYVVILVSMSHGKIWTALEQRLQSVYKNKIGNC